MIDVSSSKGLLALAGICTWSAVLISIHQIVQHLRHYTEPLFQRYIVRIVFMVPFYSVASFFGLLFPSAAPYLDTVRDCYEAWVIYNFLALCLAYVGGPGRVEVAMAGYVLTPSIAHCTCCLSPMPVDGAFVRRCKRGTLQFVLLKPVLAAATIALHHEGKFREGSWGVKDAYLWITIAYNVTYSLALFSLLLFYVGTRDLLAPHRPVLKFVCVKSVVFATFWQGVAVGIAVGVRALPSAAAGKSMQNLLLCCEMLPAAVAMAFAFPWREYAAGKGGRGGGMFGWLFGRWRRSDLDDAAAFSSGAAARAAVTSGMAGGGGGVDLTSMRHAISIRDVVADTVHQFAPAYHNYVLYDSGGNGGGNAAAAAEASGGIAGGGGGKGGGGSAATSPTAGAARTVRLQTFVAVGRETASGIGSRGASSTTPRGGSKSNKNDDDDAATAATTTNGSSSSSSPPAPPRNPFTIDEEDEIDDDEEARYSSGVKKEEEEGGSSRRNEDEEARGPLSSSPPSSSRDVDDAPVIAAAPAIVARGALRREASDDLVLDSPLAVAAAEGGLTVPAVPTQPQQQQRHQQQQQPSSSSSSAWDSVDL